MATLHLLSQSPFMGKHLSNCLLCSGSCDAILFMGDASYALQLGTVFWDMLCQLEDVKLFVLSEDLVARGLSLHSDQVGIIDYEGFVDLCVQYSKTCSWF